jgi:hypothetical protein
MKLKVSEADKVRDEAALVQDFLDHNFNWLDEMAWLSAKLPSAEEVILTDLTFTAPTQTQSGAQLNISGFSRLYNQFEDIQEKLMTDDRSVKAIAKAMDPKREKLPFGFKETVRVPLGAKPVAKTGADASSASMADTKDVRAESKGADDKTDTESETKIPVGEQKTSSATPEKGAAK